MTLRANVYAGMNAKPRRFGGVDFNGTDTYASRGADLTGNSDTTGATFSGWFRIDGGNAGTLYTLCTNNADRFRFERNSGDNFFVRCQNAAGAITFDFRSTSTYTSSAAWKHIMWSCSTGFSAGNKLAHLYVNNASDVTVVADAGASLTIDFTSTDWWLGAAPGGGSAWFNGCWADVFFHNSYIDLSVAANRAKFITPDLRPVPLGDTGSLPLGVQPLIYFRNVWGADASTFGANKGSGGAFTVSGTLAKSSTNPLIF